MYCRNCGKETENADGICDECRAREANSRPSYYDPPREDALYDKKYGFGGALAATIVGCVSAVLTYIGLILIATVVVALGADYGYGELYIDPSIVEGWDIGGLVLTIIGGIASIVSLVLGIMSIKKFKEAQRHGVKPVATLVLGIVGTVASATGILVTFCGIICYAALSMI